MIPVMHIGRTPEDFTAYVKRLEELAWRTAGDNEKYEALMEEAKLDRRSYVEALELLVLSKAEGID